MGTIICCADYISKSLEQSFSQVISIPNGVSYNSYLIADEKVCLVDTVEVDFFTQYLENIREVIGDRQVDYLVVNHMEPDHSGSIALIRKYYPQVKVVGNKKTFQMMQGFYGEGREDEHETKDCAHGILLLGCWCGRVYTFAVRANIPAFGEPATPLFWYNTRNTSRRN